jgi:hypothetical protein
LQPEIWNPETGQTEKCLVYKQVGAQTEIPIRFNPSGSLFVVFRQPAGAHYTDLEEKPAAETTGNGASTRLSTITITKAEYGIPNDPQHSVDLTQLLQDKIKDNHLFLKVGVDTGADPAPNRLKTLRVEYLQDGQQKAVKMSDGGELLLPEEAPGTCPLPDAAIHDSVQGASLQCSKRGSYTIRRSDGKQQEVQISPLPAAIDCDDHWKVRFQPGRGAPDRVVLDKLVSLSDHPDPGVKYFSGTATYSRVVKIPPDWIRADRTLYLDLGDVEVMAQVTFNQRDLGILWKPPFRLDISSLAKAGDNELEVKVADLWVNRLIGDEQLPSDEAFAPGIYNYLTAIPDWLANGTPRTSGRITFGVYQFWKKTDPLVPSGLIGPVRIIPVQSIQLSK